MNTDEVRNSVLGIIKKIAPEAEFDGIDFKENWRDQLDIDSMDFLNFVFALNRELHVDIPESDYLKLLTLDGCIEYLTSRLKP